MATELIDIGEVAAATGLAPSALRFYERQGLITSPARDGLRRQYHPDVIDRLALIAVARGAGFTVRQIGELLDVDDERSLRDSLATRLAELDDRIEHLTAVRARLAHAVACESPRLTACPHFTATLHAALPARRR